MGIYYVENKGLPMEREASCVVQKGESTVVAIKKSALAFSYHTVIWEILSSFPF